MKARGGMRVSSTAAKNAAIGAVAFLRPVLAFRIEDFFNQIDPAVLPPISPHARALHESNIILDLYSHSLLSERNLLERSR